MMNFEEDGFWEEDWGPDDGGWGGGNNVQAICLKLSQLDHLKVVGMETWVWALEGVGMVMGAATRVGMANPWKEVLET